MSKNTTHVYLIAQPGGHYKIGVAGSVDRRLAQLQSGNPVALRVAGSFPATDANAEELDLHHALAPWRTRGEWFELRPKLAGVLERYFHARREHRAMRTAFLDFAAGSSTPRPEDNADRRDDSGRGRTFIS